MKKIFCDVGSNTLFTYKVRYDRGSAPNPYHGFCTLGICKAPIRRIAKENDVIMGFALKSENEKRIVYCMIIDKSLPWQDYFNYCKDEKIEGKIPQHSHDQGDCIWHIPGRDKDSALESHSGHSGHAAYHDDVEYGKNVLVSRRFWYFGRGNKYNICIPDGLLKPVARGFRSHSNNRESREKFEEFFCNELISNNISEPGRYGDPALPPNIPDQPKARCCRAAENKDVQL